MRDSDKSRPRGGQRLGSLAPKQSKKSIPLKHTTNLLKRERNYDGDRAARASRCRPASRKNARSSPVSVKVRRGAGGRAAPAGAAPDRPLPSLRTPPLAVFFFTAKPPSQIERCARRGGGFRALSSWARERGGRSASSRFSRARSQSGVQSSLRDATGHHRADSGVRSTPEPRRSQNATKKAMRPWSMPGHTCVESSETRLGSNKDAGTHELAAPLRQVADELEDAPPAVDRPAREQLGRRGRRRHLRLGRRLRRAA